MDFARSNKEVMKVRRRVVWLVYCVLNFY